MQLPARMTAMVFAISLAIWLFFYYTTDPPLSPAETTVVVGAVVVGVTGARRIWGWRAASRVRQ